MVVNARFCVFFVDDENNSQLLSMHNVSCSDLVRSDRHEKRRVSADEAVY